MLLFLALFCLCVAAESTRECYVVSCKPYFYFWETCKCIRHTKGPIAVTLTDDRLATENIGSDFLIDSLCVVFNYKQTTTSIETDGGNELIMHMVVVQGVAIDDEQGKEYPPRIFNMHRISMSDADRAEVLAVAEDKYPLGTIEDCFPEVDGNTERRVIESVLGEDF